jgi:hypothetical protein
MGAILLMFLIPSLSPFFGRENSTQPPKADTQIPKFRVRERHGTDIQDLFHNLLSFVIVQREAIKLKNLAMRRKNYYDNRDNLNLMD